MQNKKINNRETERVKKDNTELVTVALNWNSNSEHTYDQHRARLQIMLLSGQEIKQKLWH